MNTQESADKVISPSFSLEFRTRVSELGLNPRRIAAELKMSYDHVRKVYNGQIFPGRGILYEICTKFGLDVDVMWRKVQHDKAIHKGLGEALTSNDPKLLRFERFWDYLSDQDRDEMLTLAQLRAERAIRNRQSVPQAHSAENRNGHRG